jgi:hypothetical protein
MLSEMTDELNEIVQCLTEAGAKVLPIHEDTGRVIGERGEGESFHEKERRELVNSGS